MHNNHYILRCIDCGAEYDGRLIVYTCMRCDGLLSVEFDFSSIANHLEEVWMKRAFNVWRYRELLPIDNSALIVSLGEGGTSLNRCHRLSGKLGLRWVYAKNEGENPTGSFKDRGMTVGVTKALELGMKKVACASTGNTSASLAAYAAKAGLECLILIPSGKVAFGKLAQALIHGARVIRIKGNFDEALAVIRKICISHPIYLLNSLNPFRLEGQKTIAFEIWEQLAYEVPDKVIVPVGNAGNISAIWKGFKELYHLGLAEDLPSMIGIQAEGAAPIARSMREGLDYVRFIENPETVATAIRIGAPVNWKKAVKAIIESKGIIETVSDEEILEAQATLAKTEGLFVEPASAASIAGLSKLADRRLIERDERVVCILTGHGLKDPDIVMKQCPAPVELEASIDTIVQVMTSERVESPLIVA
ncbi:MAG: threonine synthase [Nitrososphaerota archaeon]|nr:threonine synthase [Candidatus Bathyarchaeota archaeon]MDW8048667.1 threonine synthase [Nitrososphaerota archaeon]